MTAKRLEDGPTAPGDVGGPPSWLLEEESAEVRELRFRMAARRAVEHNRRESVEWRALLDLMRVTSRG